MVSCAVNHGVQKAHRRQWRSVGKVCAVSHKKGNCISTITKKAWFKLNVDTLDGWIGQKEEAQTVRALPIEVKRRVHIRGYGVSAAFVKHDDVAVQRQVGVPEELHEL